MTQILINNGRRSGKTMMTLNQFLADTGFFSGFFQMPRGYSVKYQRVEPTPYGMVAVAILKHNILPWWKWQIGLIPDQHHFDIEDIKLTDGSFHWSLSACEQDAQLQIDVALPDLVALAREL